MDNLISSLKDAIHKAIKESINKKELPGTEGVLDISLEVPTNKIYGDFSTNVAMISAKQFKLPPKKIAEIILKNLDFSNLCISKVDIAGAGFINFFVDENFYQDVLLNIYKKNETYGNVNIGGKKKVLVEYVSANPTGPMHMGNARGGAFGDCLASLLQCAGYDVKREFYINDAGNQILKFGLSLDVRYQQVVNGKEIPKLPEDCYQGKDILDLATEFYNINKDKYLKEPENIRRDALINFALPRNIEKMKLDLKKYNIKFDTWFSEKSLYENKEVERTILEFKKKNLTFEKDGALWFKATDFGAEKDEVLVRANGIPTYYLVDVAYPRNKFLVRNFDLCIDLWGADHAGHVERMKTALKALGIDENKLKVILFQLVRLVSGGSVVKMSKRTGNTVNLSDLLEKVPTDAVRCIFNMKDANTQMDFDLSLAVEQNMENPVYYIQYAHARICSVLKKAKLNVNDLNLDTKNLDLKLLRTNEEKDLIKLLFSYPEEIILASNEYNPSKIMKYLISVCANFHRFYNSSKIICENTSLTNARLMLCICTKIVINNILTMFKISAPDVM